MKTLSLGVKIMGGFLCIAVLTLIVGAVGMIKISAIEKADRKMYDENVVGLEAASRIDAMFLEMRTMTVYSAVDRFVQGQSADKKIAAIRELDKKGFGLLAQYEKTISHEENRRIYQELKTNLDKYVTARDRLFAAISAGNKDEAVRELQGEGAALGQKLTSLLESMIAFNKEEARRTAEANESSARGAMWFSAVITGLIFIAAVVLGIFLTMSITRPINRVAEGLTEGADQVAAAASQVSSASQQLAEGSSEQASSLEETSSSLEEMSSMTKQNADHANQAKAMMGEARRIVEKVSGHMQNMSASIDEITHSSDETSKIIKTIDEIAFQTNLLALNAAVEAARAGEAGAGFAVVADEVRNLAMRAAEAAKNTNNLIEGTVKAVRRGGELTNLTQEAFKENAAIAGKIGQLIDEIASASEEQAQGIGQINTAVAEMDKVTQATAASAEESASASEEMNAQAHMMKDFVQELVSMIHGGNGNHISISPAVADGRPVKKLATVSQAEMQSRDVVPAKKKVLATKVVRPDQVIPLEEDFKSF